jgi:UDP-N-acetyl-D-glucosamine dehydrogenase
MRHKPAYLFAMRSVDLDAAVGRADAVVIVTDHDGIDYAKVVRDARLVVDTRNVTSGVTSGREKIWTA